MYQSSSSLLCVWRGVSSGSISSMMLNAPPVVSPEALTTNSAPLKRSRSPPSAPTLNASISTPSPSLDDRCKASPAHSCRVHGLEVVFEPASDEAAYDSHSDGRDDETHYPRSGHQTWLE